MRAAIHVALLTAAALLVGPAAATEYLQDPDVDPHTAALVSDLYILSDGDSLDPRIAETDLAYARAMRRHHQGAVEMAERYLDDPRGTNPVIRRLAGAIIANQQFEVGVLDTVIRHVEAGPRTVMEIGGTRVVALDRGIDGLEHAQRFVEAPPPGVAELWLSEATVADFDVQFVRPMIDHHAAAIEMAKAYNADPNAGNMVVRRLNLAIQVDQAYEIDLLRRLLAEYRGAPESVPDDAGMMAIMKRSMSGMGGHHMQHPSH